MKKRYHSISEVRADLERGNITLPTLVAYYLQKIEDQKRVNAFVEVYAEEALASAARIQEKWLEGKAGKLAGLVVGIKDNICYKGHQVSAASLIVQGFESLYSATVVERLLAEDAIIIGRLNCDEFAMGSSNEKSFYGPVLNPIDNRFVPGGSSGGSAAAVAADMCLASLGSDTGGSIRQPAAYTGIVGMKPTYGRVSRHGLIAYASSFDQIGPLTSSIEDAELILSVMAGPDEFDGTLVPQQYPSSTPSVAPKRWAILKDCVEKEGLNTEIKTAFDELVQQLKQSGHTVEEVSFPYIDQLVPTYYVLTTAEASSISHDLMESIMDIVQKRPRELIKRIKKAEPRGLERK